MLRLGFYPLCALFWSAYFVLLLSLMTITKSRHTSLSWPSCNCDAVSLLSWVALLVLAMVGVVGVVLSSHLVLLDKIFRIELLGK